MRVLASAILLLPLHAAAQSPGIEFTPRSVSAGGLPLVVDMGTFAVPADHATPAAGTFKLGVARLKSTAERPAAPIVFLAGGPGASGIGAARTDLLPLFLRLREVADLILLDQRGTGSSEPRPVCQAPAGAPPDVFVSEARVAEAFGRFARSCVAEWRAKGIDPAVFDSEQSADDVAALARALGVKKISLFGFSYGTHLALATIRRHGELVERVVVAGVEGPDHNWKLPSTIERQLDTVSRRVAADSAAARLLPDFKAAVRQVLARVDAQPWVVRVQNAATRNTVDLPIGGWGMRYLIVRDLGDTNDLPN